MAPVLRDLALYDLPAVANIHSGAFPDSALTKLGMEAVRRYYEWQIVGPHDAIAIGSFDASTLVGFCFAGVFRGALGGFLEKNRSFLIRQVATHPWLLLNPLFRDRAEFAFRRVYSRLFPQHPKPVVVHKTNEVISVQQFGILSIAVVPQYQGSGVARLLMAHAENVAIERGFTYMGLTVNPSNSRAIRFYEKIGWQQDKGDAVWTGHMSKLVSP